MTYVPHYMGCVAFVIREGKILMGLRKGGAGAGEWGFPGGHVDAGESLAACAVRELQEETGLVGTNPTFVCVRNRFNESKQCNYIVFVFTVEAEGEPIVAEPESCEEWRWFPLDALPDKICFNQGVLVDALREKTVYIDEC